MESTGVDRPEPHNISLHFKPHLMETYSTPFPQFQPEKVVPLTMLQ